jgi:hypothetical protein
VMRVTMANTKTAIMRAPKIPDKICPARLMLS